MKIDILTVDGSPQQVTEKTIYGDGVQIGIGGAELALFTLCRAWTELGYKVTLYNNPREVGVSCFEQKSDDEFNPDEDRDFLIYFRGPNPRGVGAKGKKIWWSCDQATVGNYKELANEVDVIVTISKFHADYFWQTYGIENTITIDLPVRGYDYLEQIEKNPMQVLFCSVPERGLEALAPIWKMISDEVPQAQLHITSDHRLWKHTYPASISANYRLLYAGFPNVHYHSAINRIDLVKLQLQSSIQLYPNVYPELFCIAMAECQWAGCYPIANDHAALATTNMGYVSHYDPTGWFGRNELFTTTVNYLLNNEKLKEDSSKTKLLAQQRFSIDNIVEQWDRRVFNV